MIIISGSILLFDHPLYVWGGEEGGSNKPVMWLNKQGIDTEPPTPKPGAGTTRLTRQQ